MLALLNGVTRGKREKLRPRSVAELRAIVLGGETGRSNPGLPKAARYERMCWAVMCNKWVTWSHVVTQLVVT